MKCLYFLLALALLSSCQSDDEAAPDFATQLVNTRWQLADQLFTENGNLTSVYADVPPCARDDWKEFRPNHELYYDQGPLRCDTSGAQSVTGSWAVSGDTLLTGQLNAPNTPSHLITRLTADTLVLETVLRGSTGQERLVEIFARY